MKPNENVAKDLAYQQMIYNKLLEIDSRFATLFPYTNMAQDVLEGGTRLREHPLPGVSMATYEPSTLAVGGGRKRQIMRPAVYRRELPSYLDLKKGKNTIKGGGNNRMDLVKKIMKEQGLNLPQASKFIKENGLYQKVEKVIKGGGNKTGKINRLKKATKWRDFAKDTANDGLDLYERATDPFKKVKSLFGGDVKPKRPPSAWIQFVKQYASKNGLPFKEALKKAGGEYRKLKG